MKIRRGKIHQKRGNFKNLSFPSLYIPKHKVLEEASPGTLAWTCWQGGCLWSPRSSFLYKTVIGTTAEIKPPLLLRWRHHFAPSFPPFLSFLIKSKWTRHLSGEVHCFVQLAQVDKDVHDPNQQLQFHSKPLMSTGAVSRKVKILNGLSFMCSYSRGRKEQNISGCKGLDLSF